MLMDELLLPRRTPLEGPSVKPSAKESSHSFHASICSNNPLSLGLPLPLSTPHQTWDSSSIPNSSSTAKSTNKGTKIPHRSHSAPSILTDTRGPLVSRLETHIHDPQGTPSIVKQAVLGIILYIAVGVVVYVVRSGSFRGDKTYPLVDALYFAIVTLCTVGYGDMVPITVFTKIFTCAFILVGFGFIDILLNGLVSYVLDKQEAVLLSAVDETRLNAVFWAYVMDFKKGRMRVRIKVAVALVVVVGCIALGTIVVHALEGLNWVDSFYLSVTSVTTVGYGDYAFKTVEGRTFAAVWLLVSTLVVARAFLYLTELRIERRNRRIAKWVLQKKMTLGDLVAADLDNDGSISKSEFVLYKLKEMGKVAEKDILQICDQFDRLNTTSCGKITLYDLIKSH